MWQWAQTLRNKTILHQISDVSYYIRSSYSRKYDIYKSKTYIILSNIGMNDGMITNIAGN